jgi:hypothetical protein
MRYGYSLEKFIKRDHATECDVEFIRCVEGLPGDECQRYPKQAGDQSKAGRVMSSIMSSIGGNLVETTSHHVGNRLLIERSPANVRQSVFLLPVLIVVNAEALSDLSYKSTHSRRLFSLFVVRHPKKYKSNVTPQWHQRQSGYQCVDFSRRICPNRLVSLSFSFECTHYRISFWLSPNVSPNPMRKSARHRKSIKNTNSSAHLSKNVRGTATS